MDEIRDITDTKLGKEALLPLIFQLHRTKGETTDEEELLGKVTADIKEILSGIDPQDPTRMRCLGTALSTKAKSILGAVP